MANGPCCNLWLDGMREWGGNLFEADKSGFRPLPRLFSVGISGSRATVYLDYSGVVAGSGKTERRRDGETAVTQNLERRHCRDRCRLRRRGQSDAKLLTSVPPGPTQHVIADVNLLHHRELCSTSISCVSEDVSDHHNYWTVDGISITMTSPKGYSGLHLGLYSVIYIQVQSPMDYLQR